MDRGRAADRAGGAGALLDTISDRHDGVPGSLFLMLVLALAFLLDPVMAGSSSRDRVWLVDWVLIALPLRRLPISSPRWMP
jgi:hypothetical protein